MPYNRKRWADIERATVAYGYGLTVTPLQLARAYVTLGSFGFISSVIHYQKWIRRLSVNVFIQKKVTREVVHMMESVAGGGGIAAAVPGYRVAIKTGTAKKLENGRYVDKYCVYRRVAPASDPQFALVILINNPTAGKYWWFDFGTGVLKNYGTHFKSEEY